MSQSSTTAASLNAALSALDATVATLGNQIAQTTTPGPLLDQLTKRYQDVINERATLRAAATNAVLASQAVVSAAGTLSSLAAQMTTAAQALPNATNALGEATAVLSLAQQFTNIVASP
jgi:hypothetical protein